MDKYLIRFFCVYLLFFITACSDRTNTLNVAVASNFEKTLRLIVKQYQVTNKESKNPLTINIIPGSSGILANQISNNAPFDLFLSADTSKAQFVFEKKKLGHPPKIYAIGNLALWIPEQSNEDDCLKHLVSINTLAIANPNTAPYGSLAAKIIDKNNIHVEKIIHTANISQAYLYTKDNLSQAGFVAYSMLEKDAKGCIQIFQDSTLSQGMLLLNKKAEKLYQFILSKKIQNLILDSGYNIKTEY